MAMVKMMQMRQVMRSASTMAKVVVSEALLLQAQQLLSSAPQSSPCASPSARRCPLHPPASPSRQACPCTSTVSSLRCHASQESAHLELGPSGAGKIEDLKGADGMRAAGQVCGVTWLLMVSFVNDELDARICEARKAPWTSEDWGFPLADNAGTGLLHRVISFHFKTAALNRVNVGDE